MTQAALAAAVGMTRHIILHIEHGHTIVSAERLLRIAHALHCPAEALHVPLDAPIPRPTRRLQT
jgi:transcriptional regulator with XRE-family HTH domain